MTYLALLAMYWRKVPSTMHPDIFALRQCWSIPPLQNPQPTSMQVDSTHFTPTGWPTLSDVSVPSPMATMRPAPSWPPMSGKGRGKGKSPFQRWRSLSVGGDGEKRVSEECD